MGLQSAEASDESEAAREQHRSGPPGHEAQHEKRKRTYIQPKQLLDRRSLLTGSADGDACRVSTSSSIVNPLVQCTVRMSCVHELSDH